MEPNAAGIAFVAPGGLALWVKRSGAGDHAGTWCFPGGGIEDGEKPQNAARREAFEEVGFDYDGRLEVAGETKIPESTGIYTTFLARLEQPFVPKINGESAGYAWLPLNDPPLPLHPGLAAGLAADEDFKESDHPRDKDGKFGSGGGGGSTAAEGGEEDDRPSTREQEAKEQRELILSHYEDSPGDVVDVLAEADLDSSVQSELEDAESTASNDADTLESLEEDAAEITPEMRAEAEKNDEYYEADEALEDEASEVGDRVVNGREQLKDAANKLGEVIGIEEMPMPEDYSIDKLTAKEARAVADAIEAIDQQSRYMELSDARTDLENAMEDDDEDMDNCIEYAKLFRKKATELYDAMKVAIYQIDVATEQARKRTSAETKASAEAFLKRKEGAKDEALAFDRATISLRVGGSMLRPGLAFDRATVRTYDVDNRLRVAATNISKANICPYAGREIPGWEALGLDPDKVYQLFRDPDELEKAAPTFNNLPLLSKHVAVNADDHQPELVIGATGSDANFVSPYLRNSLIIWERKAIDGVEDESKKELSSAYRYRADMTPGEFMGMRYDGVMRDIVGNHVALVKEGRAGTDVVVGDSKETLEMAGKKTLRTALTVGAVAAYLLPRLSPKAGKINFEGALDGLTVDNFASRKRTMIAAITKATKGKLAHDASIDGLAAVLDMIDSGKMTKDADPDPMPKKEEEVVDEPLSADAEAVPNFLKGKLSEDDYKACMDMMTKAAAKDADPKLAQLGAAGDADKDEDEDDEAKAKAAKDAEPPPFEGKPVTKGAMDAAIAGAVKAATETANKTQKGIRDAEKAVRPWVGELAIAFDSAEAVYRHALGMLGVTHKDIHASALPHVLAVQTKPGAGRSTPAVAMDESQANDFKTRFPEAARLQAQ